ARRRVAQAVDRARGQAGLLEQLAPAALERILAVVHESRRQFPGERFQRRPVLPHDRYLSGAGERDDPHVIGLLDRMKDLARPAAGKFNLARDDADPRRDRGGAARAYARPFHGCDPVVMRASGRPSAAIAAATSWRRRSDTNADRPGANAEPETGWRRVAARTIAPGPHRSPSRGDAPSPGAQCCSRSPGPTRPRSRR